MKIQCSSQLSQILVSGMHAAKPADALKKVVCLKFSQSRHAVQMNWINTRVKPVVCMGLHQVKILQTCCFILTNQNASFRQANNIHFASYNENICMVQC